jgi:hypothetical protein
MVCFTPRKGFVAKGVTKNGKNRFTMRKDLARRNFLGLVRQTTVCGKCEGCRNGYSREWACKILHEAHTTNFRDGKFEDRCAFITLTYNPENIPLFGNLEYEKHWKKFLKRFRRKLSKDYGVKIRFYMIGEYGDLNLRPHFHAIIFGWNFPDKFFHKRIGDNDIFRSPFLEGLWTIPRGSSGAGKSFGYSSVGSVTAKSAAYVARYCDKKLIGLEFDGVEQYVHPESGEIFDRPVISSRYVRFNRENGDRVEVNKERALMSNKPGIGKSWFDNYGISDLYSKGFHCDESGNILPTPKYFDKLLEKVNPQMLEEVKRSRQDFMLQNADNFTQDRLDAAREIFLSRTKNLKRNLRNAYV